MANQQLVNYIREQLKNGYDLNAIRNNLLQHGYERGLVEESIHDVYHKGFPVVPVIAIVLAFAVVLVSFLLIWQGPTEAIPQELLDLETVGHSESVTAGKFVEFNVEITNMGAKNAYDVVIQHNLLDPSRRIVNSKQESLAVLTKASSRAQILIPANARPGRYTIETIAHYKDEVAKSSFMFTVLQETVSEEKDIDPDVGIPLDECPVDCNDMNPCTIDICNPEDPFICKHSLIEPCCGNDRCEEQENYKVCSSDCEEPDVYKTLTSDEVKDDASEKAKVNPEEALLFCDELKDSTKRDECYRAIADTAEKSPYCDYIGSDVRRDMCYGSFASSGDLTVCDKINNPYMKESCEALKG